MKNKMFLGVDAAFVEQEDEETHSQRSCPTLEEHDDSTASALLSLRNVTNATWNGAQPLYHPGSLPAASLTSISSSSFSSSTSSSSSSSSTSSPVIRSIYSGPNLAIQEARGVTPISDDEDDGDCASSSSHFHRSSYKKRNSLAMEAQSYLESRQHHQEADRSTGKRLRQTSVMKPRAVVPLKSFIAQPFIGCPLPPAPSLPRLAPGQRLPLVYKPK